MDENTRSTISRPARAIRGRARRRDANHAILAKQSDLGNQDSGDGSVGTDLGFFLTELINAAREQAIIA
jgi:hypothetical protein